MTIKELEDKIASFAEGVALAQKHSTGAEMALARILIELQAELIERLKCS